MKRAEAVTREINKKYADKKISTKEKEVFIYSIF